MERAFTQEKKSPVLVGAPARERVPGGNIQNSPLPKRRHSFGRAGRHKKSSLALGYLISTFAPAASIFFLISSASALVTPSLMVFGAPSTKAFASARPRPGTAPRTSLMTPILFAPISFRITSKVVFSSAAGAAAAPPPPVAGAAATATGAAALTPHFSSTS